MTVLEPDKRIDPDAAMRHPFIKAYLPKKHHHGAAGAGAAAAKGAVPADS